MEPPPPPSKASRCAVLFIRALTLVFLVVSLVVLTTNTATLVIQYDVFKLRFKDIYAYRYMLATIVMGVAYTILQIAMTINRVTGNISHDNLVFNFYGDKVVSYILATGAAAAFCHGPSFFPRCFGPCGTWLGLYQTSQPMF